MNCTQARRMSCRPTASTPLAQTTRTTLQHKRAGQSPNARADLAVETNHTAPHTRQRRGLGSPGIMAALPPHPPHRTQLYPAILAGISLKGDCPESLPASLHYWMANAAWTVKETSSSPPLIGVDAAALLSAIVSALIGCASHVE